MGTTIKRRDFPAVIKQLLGERMYKAKADSSSVSIVNELDAILGEEYRDITLENTDILFSPEYGLDVIKLLLQLGRNQRFYLKWPGVIAGEKLTYSEPGKFDYREYNIKDYVDTYIVLR